jgi:NitT/TauT family transport system substrate-binding protein
MKLFAGLVWLKAWTDGVDSLHAQAGSIVSAPDKLRTVASRLGCLTASCGLLVALSGVTAVAARADCARQAEVRIQEWPGDIYNIVPWVADEQGLFRKHCLDVKFVPLVGGPPAISALVAGSLDFVNQAPDVNMRPRSIGVDVRMTSNMYAGHWSALIAARQFALSHLHEGYPAIMQDLVGKKIGVTVLGGSTEAYMRSAFEGGGLSGSSATYVAVGGASTAVPALYHNVVDVEMLGGSGPELAEALGAGRIVLDYRVRGVGPKSVQALWGATLGWHAYGPFIDKNPGIVEAFTAANNEAIAWIQSLSNRNELYAAVAKHMTLPSGLPDPDATLKRIVDVNANLLGIGVPPTSIEGWNDYLLSLKQIPAPIPYDEVVWRTGRP